MEVAEHGASIGAIVACAHGHDTNGRHSLYSSIDADIS